MRQQDPTVGGKQLVGVPRSHVVALLQPRFESLLHLQLDQTPESCIDRLHFLRAPWWQQPKQSVASLLEFFLELPRRLPVQIVGEKDGLLRGHHARTPCDGGFESFVNPPVAVVAVRPGTALELDVDARVPRGLLYLAYPLPCAPENDARPANLMGRKMSVFVFLP